MSTAKDRIVVTGIGLITPLGLGLSATWNALVEGKSGIGPITRFDTSDYPVKIAGEVDGFNAEDFIEKKSLKQMDIFIRYAMAGSFMALEHAGFGRPTDMGERTGVLIASGIGGLPEIEATHKKMLDAGPRRISPFFIPRLIANLAGGQVAISVGAKGPIGCTVTACAASSQAVGEAYKQIERGEADVMIAGGTESVITPLCVGGFSAMRALSTRNDDPTKASRPFDRDRDGFVIAEGCGIVILERLSHAEKRGAQPIAEMVGYGQSCDGYHITSPPPEGEGAQRCMRAALADANMKPDEIDYINAHGTSTQLNDKFESQAIKHVFGDHAYKLKVSSTKSMTGHTLGGAGGIESAFSVMALKEGIIPPTINYENADEDCDLDYTPNKAVKKDINAALSNSFGFGGVNASLIFKKFTA